MSKIKNGRLDQYGAGPFEQQQFGTAGVEGVNQPLVQFIDVMNFVWYKPAAAFLSKFCSQPDSDLGCLRAKGEMNATCFSLQKVDSVAHSASRKIINNSPQISRSIATESECTSW